MLRTISRRSFLMVTPAVAVGGCVTSLPPVVYGDPLADLHTQLGAEAPLDRPAKAGPTVALVFGSNIERNLQFKEDGDKVFKSYGPLTNTAAMADTDPQPLITGAISVLRLKYPQITPVQDLATARAQRFATTIVLDFRQILGPRAGLRTAATLHAIFLNAQQVPISRIETTGEIPSTRIGTYQFRDASDKAVLAFKEKVDQYWS